MKHLRSRSRRTPAVEATCEVQSAPQPFGDEHRVLRWSDREVPVAGWILQSGDERHLAIMNPSDALWRFAGAQHIWAACDVLRTDEGVVALAEPCLVPLEQWLTEKRLQPGEAVTLAISMLRGFGELGAQSHTESGACWLTESGRPVIVLGAGRAASVEVSAAFALIASQCADHAFQRLAARIERELSDPLAALADLERWEAELLELAAPRPLVVQRGEAEQEALALATADIESFHATAFGFAAPTPLSQPLRSRERRKPLLLRGRDLLTHRSTRAMNGHGAEHLRTRLRNLVGTVRIRPGIVALVAAGAVLGCGLLWPQTESTARADALETVDAPEQAMARTMRPAPHEAPESPTTPAPESPHEIVEASERVDASVASDDPQAIAESIVAAVIECLGAGDAMCAHVRVGESTELVSRLGEIAAGGYTVEVVEQFGDVVVTRVVAPELTEIVVLERTNENWLLREVYPIAEQPIAQSSEGP